MSNTKFEAKLLFTTFSDTRALIWNGCENRRIQSSYGEDHYLFRAAGKNLRVPIADRADRWLPKLKIVKQIFTLPLNLESLKWRIWEFNYWMN
jgi:hypothetical protein